MTPDTAARLAEFARACKAAARIVSLYPPSHPSLQAALSRIVAAGQAATVDGPFSLVVLPDTLLVDGRGLPRPDAAVAELAELLHQHLVGELTLTASPGAAAWHMLLSLLARAPEDVRAEGGIARAWEAAGGGPVTITEIDYAEVLRERGASQADTASWEAIITACLSGDLGPLDDETLAALVEIAGDRERLAAFLLRLEERSRASDTPPTGQKQSLLRLLHGLANYAATAHPDAFDTVMTNMAAASIRLTPDTMLALLTDPPPPRPAAETVPPVDVGGELQSRISDEMLGEFIAGNVARDRRATGRLAEAFHALAPEEPRRQDVLALAGEQAGQSAFGSDPQFESLWANAMSMLMSYSDTEYVPEDYGRELDYVRTRAVDVEAIADDPPDRIAAWVATVASDDVRALDQQMLLDLLRIEDRPAPWASMLDVALGRLEQFVLVGDLGRANELVGTIAGIASNGNAFAPAARDGLSRLTSGPMVPHLVLFMRQAAEAEMPALMTFCQGVGPSLVQPLADALGQEEHRLSVRRIKDVLIGFGPASANAARALGASPNPAVRRAAVDVLRAVAGADALAEFRALLADPDPQVQREALRAILHVGTNEAYAILEDALKNGEPGTRDAIVHSIGALRDERAAPLLVHILSHSGRAGALEPVYVSAIEALGRTGVDAGAVAALTAVLHRRDWWAPGRTTRLRQAAARALRAMDTPAADEALRDAATRGGRGVRAAAETAMHLPRRPRPSGGTT